MSRKKLICASIIVVTSFVRQGFSEGPTPVAEQLKERHIALDVPSLMQALQNSDADIRGLAAVQLGGEKAIAAAPAIEDALVREQVVRTRIRMALALSWLGENKGTEVLKDICTNSRIATPFRAFAASYLLDVKDTSCFDAVLIISESDPEPLLRKDALMLLPKFKNVPEDRSGRIYTSAIKSLLDSDPAVRLAASQTCVALENAAAIPELQRAIASEGNNDVRREMEKDVGRLKEKVQEKKKHHVTQ